jgi:ArsR family transcriptional regulator
VTIPTLEELQILHRNICQAVGDPKRIQILYALHDAPRSVNALAEDLDMPQPTVSRHLGILKQRSIVCWAREGGSSIYRLTDDRIITVLDSMRSMAHDLLQMQVSHLDSK